ncbi:D-erythrulose 4-kinase [Myceligenerans cantabricum]
MTRLYNDPAAFTQDAMTGFTDAHQRYVAPVPGGVVRTTRTRPGKVAVVVGGGSGHYPAFCGVVGPGFADGAVVGNVFTSPSAADAVSVARAADSGAGVVFSTGNYAGDVMNFNQAVERLQDEGVAARYVLVTDDVASAPSTERARRRGIAGDVTVFKAMSAAAEEGCSLDEVVRVGEHANDRTRTLGVAFDGCTLPGADDPLFTVEPGHMGLGLGIHGEPGISDEKLPTARELARTLVDGVLADAPQGAGRRVTAILNGLGRTKYEELFIVWGTVARLLREAGYEVVEPDVGELVTSLDMAGCSLTVMWLDDELERLWAAPADTPAYRKGAVTASATGERRTAADTLLAAEGTATGPADEEAQEVAGTVLVSLEAIAAAMTEAEDELGRIDAVAGDGDHGRGMVNGSTAAVAAARAAVERGAGPRTTLDAAGDAWAAKAGGSSGVLWGNALVAVGKEFGDAGRPSGATVAAAVSAGYDALVKLGGAAPGDKTMLDALLPFAHALTAGVAGGRSLADAWEHAAREATTSAARTAGMRPRVGRARPLAERSLGTPDAGAVSMAMCLTTVAGVLARTGRRQEEER